MAMKNENEQTPQVVPHPPWHRKEFLVLLDAGLFWRFTQGLN